MSDRTEALTDLLDDLAGFAFKPNDYYNDLEPQNFIDSILTGKIGGRLPLAGAPGGLELV